MKKRIFKLLRIVTGAAGVIGWAALCLAIRTQHMACYPALYAVNRSSLLIIPFLLPLLLLKKPLLLKKQPNKSKF